MSRSFGTPASHGRDVLVSEAMRPSNATAQWHRRLGQPDIVEKDIARHDQSRGHRSGQRRMEALAIAVAMREARHLNKRRRWVTPDRALARRVTAALGRLESRIRRFRRRRADGHIGGIFARLAAEAGGETA